MSTLLSSIETQVRQRLMEPASLATPGSITVTPQGTPGTSIYTYKLVAVDTTGTTEAGAASATLTGAATLNGTNYNRLTWTAVTGASGYWIYRVTAGGSSPTTLGRIAVLGAVTTFDDQGSAGDSSTAPSSNSSGLTSPFWTSAELIGIINAGIRDLWRATVDLKQEHYLTVDRTHVTLAASTSTLTGVPSDVHKVYIIEPLDLTESGSNSGLSFIPKDYNSSEFQGARSRSATDPANDVLFYAVTGQGAPVSAPTIYVAPQVTSAVSISFCYVPSLGTLTSSDTVPIPGEADNALIAWGVAFARAKEEDGHTPDMAWLAIYAAEKQNLLQSLGLRDYSNNSFVEAVFEGNW